MAAHDRTIRVYWHNKGLTGGTVVIRGKKSSEHPIFKFDEFLNNHTVADLLDRLWGDAKYKDLPPHSNAVRNC